MALAPATLIAVGSSSSRRQVYPLEIVDSFLAYSVTAVALSRRSRVSVANRQVVLDLLVGIDQEFYPDQVVHSPPFVPGRLGLRLLLSAAGESYGVAGQVLLFRAPVSAPLGSRVQR